MSGMIKISGNNGKPISPQVIKGLRTFGEIGYEKCSLKYITENFDDYSNLKHFIYINNYRKEITNEIKKDEFNNEFQYELNNLKEDTTYNIFIEIEDGENSVKSNSIQFKTLRYKIYGVKVDESNSNPQQSLTYDYDAIGIISAKDNSLNGWDNNELFKDIKLVGFKDGKETKEINPNNKTKYTDGSTVPNDVDVMVRLPKFYWKFINTSNGYEILVCKGKKDESYDCYAHKVNGVEKDNIYIGAYLGYVENDKLRSITNILPTVNKPLTNFRTYANNVGKGYHVFNYNSLLALQILFILSYKNLNSQSALGLGLVSNNSLTKNGLTDKLGMLYGNNTATAICFLGVENLWGNVRQWADGLRSDSNYYTYNCDKNDNFDDIDSYKILGRFHNSNVGFGSIDSVVANNQCGFIIKTANGSTTTHYCDNGEFTPDKFLLYGGDWTNNTAGGLFYGRVRYQPIEKATSVGVRLCYLG